MVQQLVDLGDGGGFGLPDFPGGFGDWQGEGAGLAAGQAGVGGDGVALVRVTVTSVSSSRAMRLRSRMGVAGSCQMPGRSVTSWLIRSFWAGVRVPSCCWRALS